MQNLNLKKLLSGDPIGSIVEKINENFSQLESNGGGPLGPPGYQGPPGLPGTPGKIGNVGQAGKNGKQLTITEEDSNWGVEYEGDPTGESSANNAVSGGFNIGDIWIDTNIGVFYVIEENTTDPGNYLFIPYPLQSSGGTGSGLWDTDTLFNTIADDVEKGQGIKLGSRYATVSLTSRETTVTPSNAGDPASYNEFMLLDGSSVLSYKRPAFKLSIDNVTNNSGEINRVSDVFFNTDANNKIIYNQSYNDFAPLIYFENTTTDNNNQFGLLSNATDPLLVLSSSNQDGEFLVDTKLQTLRGDQFRILANDRSIDQIKSYTATNFSAEGNILINPSLWLAFSTKDNINENESDSPSYNTFGVRLGVHGTKGTVSIYPTLDSTAITSSDDHIVSFAKDFVYFGKDDDVQSKSKGSLNTNRFDYTFETTQYDGNPYLGNTGFSNLLIKGNGDAIPGRAASVGIGSVYKGFGAGRGAVGLIYALDVEASGSCDYDPLILQPTSSTYALGELLTTGNSINDDSMSVNIGRLGKSRFNAEGNAAIGDSITLGRQAPNLGLWVEGNTTIGHYKNTLTQPSPTTPGSAITGYIGQGDVAEYNLFNPSYFEGAFYPSAFTVWTGQGVNDAQDPNFRGNDFNNNFFTFNAQITTKGQTNDSEIPVGMLFTHDYFSGAITVNNEDRKLTLGIENPKGLSNTRNVFRGKQLNIESSGNTGLGLDGVYYDTYGDTAPLMNRLVIFTGGDSGNNTPGSLNNGIKFTQLGTSQYQTATDGGNLTWSNDNLNLYTGTSGGYTSIGSIGNQSAISVLSNAMTLINRAPNAGKTSTTYGNILRISDKKFNGSSTWDNGNTISIDVGIVAAGRSTDLFDGGYVGYNASYDRDNAEFVYAEAYESSRFAVDGTTRVNAGVVNITDQNGGFHIAAVYDNIYYPPNFADDRPDGRPDGIFNPGQDAVNPGGGTRPF